MEHNGTETVFILKKEVIEGVEACEKDSIMRCEFLVLVGKVGIGLPKFGLSGFMEVHAKCAWLPRWQTQLAKRV